MKLTLLILLFTWTFSLTAQIEIGKTYYIETLLGSVETDEYILREAIEKEGEFLYGNLFKIDSSGTFHSWYTAPCGNDCFTYNMGTSTFIDNKHVAFTLTYIDVHGDCEHVHKATVQPLGTYSIIVKDSLEIQLLKSRTHNNEKALEYLQLINDFSEIMESDAVFQEIVYKKIEGENVADIVNEYLKATEGFSPAKANILFTKAVRYNRYQVTLIEHKKKIYYLIYDLYYNQMAHYPYSKS